MSRRFKKSETEQALMMLKEVVANESRESRDTLGYTKKGKVRRVVQPQFKIVNKLNRLPHG